MPQTPWKLAAALLLLVPLFMLEGCGCGFDCNDDDDNGPALLSLSLSDALPEDLSDVVIKLDAITLRRSGNDVVIDRFADGDSEVATLTIDLLDYRGVNRIRVVENLEIERGTYSSIVLTIMGGDPNFSHVIEQGSDEQVQLDPVSNFSLPGFTAVSGSQEYVIEFALTHSLSQRSSGTYELSTEGVLVANFATAATLSGQADSVLFDAEAPCDNKEDPLVGNRAYLYEGRDLNEEDLADIFTSGSNTTPPEGALSPFAGATLIRNTLTGAWEYSFGYLPAGDYTLAFSCNTADDDPTEYDGLDVPLPAGQVYPLTLEEAQSTTCNITEAVSCQ